MSNDPVNVENSQLVNWYLFVIYKFKKPNNVLKFCRLVWVGTLAVSLNLIRTRQASDPIIVSGGHTLDSTAKLK